MNILQEQGFPKKFPCGEIHVKIDPNNGNLDGGIWIEKRIQNSDDILEILMLVDAIRRDPIYKRSKLRLRIPYVPYSRQDRVMVPGESLSIKVFADLINSLKLDEVEIWDPHSDVTPALIDNCTVISQEDLLDRTLGSIGWNNYNYTLICPDAGARKKILKIAKKLDIKRIIYADKVRDVATGNILGTTIDFGDFNFQEGSKFLIVDDICEYGRTFTEIAKKLVIPMTGKKYTVDLHVTHGFFPDGLKLLHTYFDTISCANLMNPGLAPPWSPNTDKFIYYSKV